MAVTISDCCCGDQHRMASKKWHKLSPLLAAKPFILVGNVHNCWYVPRLYLLFHINPAVDSLASRLRMLAEQYGWERFDTRITRSAPKTDMAMNGTRR